MSAACANPKYLINQAFQAEREREGKSAWVGGKSVCETERGRESVHVCVCGREGKRVC
jgi:hypothetical protein